MMSPGPWRTASASSNSGGNCVRVRQGGSLPEAHGPRIEVGDSKMPDGGTLAIPATEWTALLDSVK
jgi:hypothetical protein